MANFKLLIIVFDVIALSRRATLSKQIMHIGEQRRHWQILQISLSSMNFSNEWWFKHTFFYLIEKNTFSKVLLTGDSYFVCIFGNFQICLKMVVAEILSVWWFASCRLWSKSGHWIFKHGHVILNTCMNSLSLSDYLKYLQRFWLFCIERERMSHIRMLRKVQLMQDLE